jgi:phosphate starvation-inducible protein PhoH and related proteins
LSIKKKNGSRKPAAARDEFFSNLTNPQHVMAMKPIKPLTPNQTTMFDMFGEGHNLFIHGYAGTGKTLLSLYLGLSDVLSNQTVRKQIIILRSVVPSRDMGFLPGSAKDKAKVFERPYVEACTQLFDGPNPYETLKSKGVIEFDTTSFLRGLTFKNSVIYIDEIQNCSDGEIHTMMTRIGEGCRVIVSGDVRQTDLQRDAEKLGCMTFVKTMEKMDSFRHIEFGVDDILRSGFVKDYILARTAVLDEK